jgi:hypothetical protein
MKMANTTSNIGFRAGNQYQGGFKFEPLRRFRWELEVFQLAGFDRLKLALLTCSRPNFNSEITTVEHFNDKFYIAGKTIYEPITFRMYDAIPDGETGLYTSQIIEQWRNIIFDPRTNLMYPAGGTTGYKRDAVLTMYDGLGNEQVSWSLIGCWPQTLNYTDLDYSSSDTVMIDVTMKIDKAFLNSTTTS